jgi:hypothetical protein
MKRLKECRDRAANVLPWLEHSARLISWMEILKFSAEQFYDIGRITSVLWAALKEQPADQKPTSGTKNGLLEMTAIIQHGCKSIGLGISLKQADRLLDNVKTDQPCKHLRAGVDALQMRIKDEIADHLFLFIPQSHVKYYEGANLFGETVEQAFPSTTYDIKESGKCLALHRNTASVCHSMRVLEIGLRALAGRLKISYENKPWNYVIEVADKKIKRNREKKRKPRNWKVDEKFYSEAIAHFRFLKDAWRNYSMHVYERYDEEQAQIIFDHSRAFMRHLATKLKE